MNIPEFNEIIEPNDQTEARRDHLNKIKEIVGNAYPNKFERSKVSGDEDTITNLVNFPPLAEVAEEMSAHVATLAERERPNAELKEKLNAKLKDLGNVRISGRLAVPPRVMGKAAFVHLSDGISRLQIYIRKDDAKLIKNDNSALSTQHSALDSAWELFGYLDHGDFIGVEGFLFLTNTGELSVHVEKLQFLAKAMLPMPDKMHGINDPELQRRYRYADLIASSLQIEHEDLTTREVFERRAKLISGMRRFLDDAGYIEVETPMLTPKATGAAAKPFSTHHNALDIPMFARIAPELYLKRLVVGGFEKVYELNRNFRNEGLSNRHNPEFTMLEFYCAYMDVNGMMDFAEAMIKESVQKATSGSLQVKYGENEIDFSKFERLTMKEAIAKYWGVVWNEIKDDDFKEEWTENLASMRRLMAFGIMMKFGVKNKNVFGAMPANANQDFIDNSANQLDNVIVSRNDLNKFWDLSKLFENSIPTEEEFERNEIRPQAKFILTETFTRNTNEESQMAIFTLTLFEEFVEERLIQPTFIIDYPKSISPLSKASPENPNIAERFELFINGMECANGFSELNDPQEQYYRFADQMKERESGDEEAMVLDEDYIRALAYGMPPAAGIGIGIDRLVMLLTNKHSIRDVILFPHMRPIVREQGEKDETTETPPVNPS